MLDLTGKTIFVTSHRGMVASAIVRRLESEGLTVLTAPCTELDLRDQAAVKAFMAREKSNVVVIAWAKVGGIHANNTQPAEFIYDNLMIASNLIEAIISAMLKSFSSSARRASIRVWRRSRSTRTPCSPEL